MNIRYSILFILNLALAAGFTVSGMHRSAGMDEGTAGEIQTGRLTLRFQERHPLSRPEVMARRFQGSDDSEASDLPLKEYRLSWETFSAYIPATYDGSEAFGLFVWVAPGSRGGPPEAYEDALERLRLIWIGGDGIGNDRVVSDRMGLSLDAAYNMRQRYRIDPERVYIGGFSGGGRTASEMAFLYPDVFAGGFFLMGCNFYNNLIVIMQGVKRMLPGFSPRLDGELIAQAVEHRYVFMTAESDFNRAATNVVFRAYKKAGVKFASYLEIPGWGHRLIPAEWFGRAVEALDRPLRVCDAGREPTIHSDDLGLGEVQALGEEQPVQAVLFLERMKERAEDRAERRQIRELLKSLLTDKDVKVLSDLFAEVRSFQESLCREGTTLKSAGTVLELRSKIEGFLRSEPPEDLADEARRLLEEI